MQTHVCYNYKKKISPKNVAKMLAIFVQTTASFSKTLILPLCFEKNAIFPPKIGKNLR
jgi:hypothetical protein